MCLFSSQTLTLFFTLSFYVRAFHVYFYPYFNQYNFIYIQYLIHFSSFIYIHTGPSAKRQKLSSCSSPDDGIYWRMNEDRFELLFRDRLLVKAVENRLDRSAAEVFRAMLRLNELSSDATSETSALLSAVEGTSRN